MLDSQSNDEVFDCAMYSLASGWWFQLLMIVVSFCLFLSENMDAVRNYGFGDLKVTRAY